MNGVKYAEEKRVTLAIRLVTLTGWENFEFVECLLCSFVVPDSSVFFIQWAISFGFFVSIKTEQLVSNSVTAISHNFCSTLILFNLSALESTFDPCELSL